MAVAFILDFAGGTAEQYDQVIDRMGLGGRTAPGRSFHAAGPTDDGWRVVDVWDSDEQFQSFAQEKIGPFTQEVGLTEPQITRIEPHNAIDAREGGDSSPIEFLQVVHLTGMDEAGFDDADAEIRGGEIPEGMVFHVNGPADDGWIVADAWTSKDIRDRFMGERVAPAMGARGMAPPAVDEMAVHNTLS